LPLGEFLAVLILAVVVVPQIAPRQHVGQLFHSRNSRLALVLLFVVSVVRMTVGGVRVVHVIIVAALCAVLVLAVVVFQSSSPQRVGQLAHNLSSRVAVSVLSAVVATMDVMMMMMSMGAIGVILVALCWFRRGRLWWAWRIVARHVLIPHNRSQ
jgi:hypothetical protein